MTETDLLNKFYSKSEAEKKELIEQLYELASNLDVGNLNSPIGFIDLSSDKNLDKKFIFLTRFITEKPISDSDLKDRTIFELLPQGDISKVNIN